MLSLPKNSFVTPHHRHPNREPTEPKMSLGGVSAWSWLEVTRQAPEAEKPEGGILRGNSHRVGLSYMVCVSTPLYE